MAVRGRGRSLRPALWAGAGLAVALIGLFTSMHESSAHDACVALAKGLPSGSNRTGLNCGFANTVYWAGIVVLIAGALSCIAAAGSAISITAKARGASARSTRRPEGSKAFGQTIDPTDPVTRWQLDPATDWRPGPAGWQAGPATAVPFVPPIRDSEDAAGASLARTNTLAEVAAERPAPAPSPEPPPPAWYADPERKDAIRWWDGSTWGESRPNPQ